MSQDNTANQPPTTPAPTAAPIELVSARTRKVKDPIYGYVYLSELEHLIIQDPLMLRLHYVRQVSTAYLTYPSAQGTRFPHSLGAMHIAGQILARALHAASDETHGKTLDVVKQILKAADLNFVDICNDCGRAADVVSDGLYRLYHLMPTHHPADRREDGRERRSGDEILLAKLLLFQGVRFACLVHDLGHPPYSHIAEKALERSVDGYCGHEEAGLQLLRSLMTRFRLRVSRELDILGKAALAIAAVLIDKDRAKRLNLAGVARIVSGDIDADRLDYVRRDAFNGGLSTINYDVGRLVESARLVTREGCLDLIYTTDALSAVESFFVARFQLYRWMVWHHNVVRMDLCLERSIDLLLTVGEGLPNDVVRFREDILRRAGSPSEDGYRDFDDGYLVAGLRRSSLPPN